MRRYLFVRPDGGGVLINEFNRDDAVNVLAETEKDKRGAEVKLDNALNGEHFVSYWGEAEIVVLVDLLPGTTLP